MGDEREWLSAGELSRRLAARAEAVCRHFLPKGRREGRVWRIGDIDGAPGRSLAVRLVGPSHGCGAAGRWIDSATCEYGDLLDLIAHRAAAGDLGQAMREARAFLALPDLPTSSPALLPPARDTVAAARALWDLCQPIAGTLAERYLRGRAIVAPLDGLPLRFHPELRFRVHEDAPLQRLPALVAAVTDADGVITGVQRTWLDPAGGKARVIDPRRSLGRILSAAVRLPALTKPAIRDGLVVGEGLETVLSLRDVLSHWPTAACLSAGHLARLSPPPHIRRLIIARDNGAAGGRAAATLAACMSAQDVAVIVLRPILSDMNADRMQIGEAFLRERFADIDA